MSSIRVAVRTSFNANWYGTPVELGDGFHSQEEPSRGDMRATVHQSGWGLRLFIGRDEIVQTRVFRSQDEVLTTAEQWKAAMMEKGWQA